MSEIQKNNITQLLKEKNKSKRELAHFLNIHENGINRMLSNPDIRLKRLEQIANFLDIDISILIKIVCFSKKEIQSATELNVEKTNNVLYTKIHSSRACDSEISEINEELVLKLSEVIKGQKLIEDITKKNGETLMEITDLLMNPAFK
ncbi:MAG: helix-turn-helix transcriptional regulator [Dysgonamonadaceae bacterium]|jgi:DNA-binding Xre family transcriptional regulator|nr:helix-turn-helix transcriptional regulator [Dysgonamonadaceae bacterium]